MKKIFMSLVVLSSTVFGYSAFACQECCTGIYCMCCHTQSQDLGVDQTVPSYLK